MYEKDDKLGEGSSYNYWLGQAKQGFIIKLDECARTISGCQLKNKGEEITLNARAYGTKEFKVLGATNKSGPWNILLEEELEDTRNKPAPLLNFTFSEPATVQFLKFEVISHYGPGGGLQYFAAIPLRRKYIELIC